METRRILLALPILLTLIIALNITPPNIVAHTEGEPYRVDLIAGKSMDVGDVLVWNDEENLYVRYATDGWGLVETHLAVATDLEDIPQTKKGNPKVGKFPYKHEDLGGVLEDLYTIPLEWDAGTTLYIAAHAVVAPISVMVIVSDTDVMVTDGSDGSFPRNAVYAWEPFEGKEESYWDSSLDFIFDNGADWIWESERVVNPVNGDIVSFERSFEIDGYPISGILDITCDNGYEAYLNGEFIGSGQVEDGWMGSDLKEGYVHTSGWQTVEHYDVSGLLNPGGNILEVIAVNEYMNTDDVGDDGKRQLEGDEIINPGGLIFELTITYLQEYSEETAWADGTRFVDRGSWATYFTYEIQG